MPLKIISLLFIFYHLFLQLALAGNQSKNGGIIQSNLNWVENEDGFKKEKLIWKKVDIKDERQLFEESLTSKKNSRELNIKALDRSVSVNYLPYPEISHYVPNGYLQDDNKFITASLRTISKLRFCDSANFDTKCADGLLNLDFNLLNRDTYSFNTKFSLQSISNRGTPFGEESSLGFKLAKEISPKWSVAIGGENLIHFDNSIDLGRNFYFVASTYQELNNRKENPTLLFINLGVGSDFYGYKGNGFLARTSCFGQPNLTGNGTNTCSWGPFGSAALAFNDRISFVNEWFGYGYGTGISFKPLVEKPLIFSIYATDFIKGFPIYAEEHCPNNECTARFYGNISLSF